MLEIVVRLATQAWITANRTAAYAMQNLIDDPAILAMGFC